MSIRNRAWWDSLTADQLANEEEDEQEQEEEQEIIYPFRAASEGSKARDIFISNVSNKKISMITVAVLIKNDEHSEELAQRAHDIIVASTDKISLQSSRLANMRQALSSQDLPEHIISILKN